MATQQPIFDGSSPSDPSGNSPAAGSSSSPSSANKKKSPTPSSANGASKQHLSEEQKKANHIASEKKRRNNIREQYDNLAEMVPGMSGMGRSEGRVLEETVKYSLTLAQERQAMIRQIREAGGYVDPALEISINSAIRHLQSRQQQNR